jgi:parvulin-like peptidyl-prolyl isomerase
MKDEGGDLGMRPVTTLPPFLVEAARQLGPGDISDLIESEFGYHIIQFVDSREGVAADPEQWREPIRQRLRRSKGEEAVERYTAKIMGDEEVVQEYFLPQLERQLAARPDLLAELQQVPE